MSHLVMKRRLQDILKHIKENLWCFSYRYNERKVKYEIVRCYLRLLTSPNSTFYITEMDERLNIIISNKIN